MSKLCYCINLWGGLWDVPGSYDEQAGNRTSITKKDMHRLQVLQNKVMRIQTADTFRTPTSTLLQKTKQLSIHQMVAYYTSVQVYNIEKNKAPKYHHDRLFGNLAEQVPPDARHGSQNRVEFKLSLARGSFFYQGSQIWAAIPNQIKMSRNLCGFKKEVKQWISLSIKMKH